VNNSSKPSTIEYWNERANVYKDNKDVLFLDPRRDAFWQRVRDMLKLWRDDKVLDVCCGYGQFAHLFKDYLGIDFSSEMIRRGTDKRLLIADAREFSDGKYDVIFEVNSLHSLGWTPEQFFEKYKDMANKIVACLECDKFTIFHKYK